MRSFPEVDRAQWFSLQDARARLNPAQAAFVDRVADILDSSTT
jgi:predicted NUDIX family NTP pyrophosphohydrolase